MNRDDIKEGELLYLISYEPAPSIARILVETVAERKITYSMYDVSSKSRTLRAGDLENIYETEWDAYRVMYTYAKSQIDFHKVKADFFKQYAKEIKPRFRDLENAQIRNTLKESKDEYIWELPDNVATKDDFEEVKDMIQTLGSDIKN